MGDVDVEKEYLEKKARLRKLHKQLKDTKHIQEIYHKIMGSSETEEATESSDDEMDKAA